MKYLLFFSISLFSFALLSQKVECDRLTGIGFLKIPKNRVVQVYDNEFKEYQKIKKSNYKNLNFLLDFSNTEFVLIECLEATDSTFIIKTNNQLKSKHIVFKDKFIQFINIQEHILAHCTICENNNFRDSIDGEPMNFIDHVLKPVKFEGDWLMVETDYFDNTQSKWVKQTGWVQWRFNGKIVIQVIYLV